MNSGVTRKGTRGDALGYYLFSVFWKALLGLGYPQYYFEIEWVVQAPIAPPSYATDELCFANYSFVPHQRACTII